MKLSLVMCTLNRPREVARFLDSLAVQTYRDFEMIVVDQSGDDRYVSVLSQFAAILPLTHLRSPPGASRARNVGARQMSGDILTYPDDDCTYPPDFLQRVVTLLQEKPEFDGICTAVAGSDFWDRRAGLVTPRRIWWQGLDFSTFLRKPVIDSVGGMNESLGPGAGTPWGSCEATDLMLRAMEKGFRFWYQPDILVEHPGPIGQDTSLQLSSTKTRTYAMGKGHVLRMHHFPLWFVSYMIARPLAGMAMSLLRGRLSDVRMYATYSFGIMTGYFS